MDYKVFSFFVLGLLLLGCQQSTDIDLVYKSILNVRQVDTALVDRIESSFHKKEVLVLLGDTSDVLFLDSLYVDYKSLRDVKKDRQYLRPVDTSHKWLDISKLKNEDHASIEKLKILTTRDRAFIERHQLLDYLKNYVLTKNIKSYKELFIYTAYLEVLANYYSYQNQQEKAWSIYLRGIHVIDDYDSSLSQIKAKFIFHLLISISRETNVRQYFPLIKKFLSKLSVHDFDSFEGLMNKAYLVEEDSLLFKGEIRLVVLNQALEIASNPYQKMIAHLNIGYYYEGLENYKVATEYYQNALNQFDDTCSKHYFTTLLYLIGSCQDDKRKSILIELLLKYRSCELERIDFILPGYLDLSLLNLSHIEYIEILSRSRKMAEKLFPPYSSLHLQDFYVGNYFDLLGLYSNDHSFTSKDIEMVVTTCLDTRLKEDLRKKVSSSIDGNISVSGKIQKYLHQINEFKSYDRADLNTYNRLFQIYMSMEENISNYPNDSFCIDSLVFCLERDSMALLNITCGVSKYSYYYYNDDNFEIGHFDKSIVDSLALLTYNEIISQKKNIENALATYISTIFRPTNKKMGIVIDGVFVSMPTKELFNDIEVYLYKDVNQYLRSSNLNIKNVSIYSFTDSIDVSSIEKKQYPDLPYSLLEINGVKSSLRDKANCSKLNFIPDYSSLSSSTDFLHLSTHAYSSSLNRLDNYFLSKESDGIVNKNYGYEMYSQACMPKVVVLSACDSGIGLHAYGAGVQTLSRAFLDNGTQTVIKTLWKVNEKATAEFMIKMYTYWSTGISLYRALDKTQEDFKHHTDYCHPYYWAGFVLEGNPNVYLDVSNSDCTED